MYSSLSGPNGPQCDVALPGRSSLPPGYRFHPTDEELVCFYLKNKIIDVQSEFIAIGEVDFNRCEPWDLPGKAKMGENKFCYFFSLKDKKYPTGTRTNRATESGYWKATGKDREVMSSRTGKLVGMKKTLVFYKGRAPKGEKTNWVMHEYRLAGDASSNDREEWVVCRTFQKNFAPTKRGSDFGPSLHQTYPTMVDSPESSDQQLPSIYLTPLQDLETDALNLGDSIVNFDTLWNSPDLEDIKFAFQDNPSDTLGV